MNLNMIQIAWEASLESKGRESCWADELWVAHVAKETHYSIL